MPQSSAATTGAEATLSSPRADNERSFVGNLWDKQEWENDLWYKRFLHYLELGPTRSVSLAATGRRNAYPMPSHWPIVARQNFWHRRAEAYDVSAIGPDSEVANEQGEPNGSARDEARS